MDSSDSDFGGMARLVFYEKSGHWQRDDGYNTGATEITVVALWKYAEYLATTGQAAEAARRHREAWVIARPAGDYLHRAYDPQTSLMHGTLASRDLWVSDSDCAADALRCLSRWAQTPGLTAAYDYDALASRIVGGIQAMKDTETGRGFFKYRDSQHSLEPTDGESLDQLVFLLYEAETLPPRRAVCT